MLSVQHEANRSAAAVCAECCRWVGSAEDILEGVVRWAGARSAGARAGRLPEPAGAVRCDEGCGAIYCSEDCRRVAWGIHHRMLCTGCGAAGTPEGLSKGAALHRGALLQYERIAETAGCEELFQLLARSVVDVLGAWEAEGRTPSALLQAMAPYDGLHCVAWWDVPGAGARTESGEEHKAEVTIAIKV